FYFIVELVDGYADESSGQIAQQLLEIHCWFGASTILLRFGARAGCVFRSFEASHHKGSLAVMEGSIGWTGNFPPRLYIDRTYEEKNTGPWFSRLIDEKSLDSSLQRPKSEQRSHDHGQ